MLREFILVFSSIKIISAGGSLGLRWKKRSEDMGFPYGIGSEMEVEMALGVILCGSNAVGAQAFWI